MERGNGAGGTAVSVLVATSLAESRWFQLLGVFVGFNTIVYAAFAFGKLWPRRRR
jgi:hypothetical protein